MNWRVPFLRKLDELTPFQILTYKSVQGSKVEDLFSDAKVIDYLRGRILELDAQNAYTINDYEDFYSVVMCLWHTEQTLFLRCVYAAQTNKQAFLRARRSELTAQEQLIIATLEQKLD